MIPYADTNFFTRFFLELPGSEAAHALIEEGSRLQFQSLPVTWLHRLEVCNALQLHVFQGRVPGHKRITNEQAGAAWAMFREAVVEVGLLHAAVLSPEEVERQFEELSLRHTARHGFRAYDILHVASALLLRCDTFWSFDANASRLAKLEGLKVIRGN